MAEIKKVNGRAVIDYMARDYDSLLRSMRSLIPGKLPEWKEYESEADFGNVLLQLFAHMGDILSYYQDRVANESFLGTARERRSIIHHLRLIGYRLATAAPASTFLEVTVSGERNDTITIRKGDAFATKSQKGKPSIRFEYTGENFVIDFNNIAAVNGKKTYSPLPVEEGRLVKDEIIGKPDKSPNQRFPLAHRGLILQSQGLGSTIRKEMILKTEPETKGEWTLRESLAFSQEGQKDFVIEIDEEDRGFVVFGDGKFGRIPWSGENTSIKATYRKGGGAHGNVAAHSIDTIVDCHELALLGAKVTNPVPATGGADRESIEHAVRHAPAVFRSQKRAVTAADYKDLALDFRGVGKVRAEKGNWNKVILYVAPEGGGKVSDVLKQNLLAYFEDKRPISTIVEIEDVDYVRIYVIAEVGIYSYYSWQMIEEKIRAGGANLLAFENVDFGQTLYISKFYEALEDVEGVEYITITEFRREDTKKDEHFKSGKIELKENEIPVVPADPGDEDYAGGIKVINDRGM